MKGILIWLTPVANPVGLGILFLLGAGLVLHVTDKERKAMAADTKAALAYFRSEAKVSQEQINAAWHSSRALVQYRRGNYNKAIDEFSKSIELLPYSRTLSFRAAAYYETGDLDSAIADWEAAALASNDGEFKKTLEKNLENAKKARTQKK
jgi:tetratricopeptide (TPR) repeat protein